MNNLSFAFHQRDKDDFDVWTEGKRRFAIRETRESGFVVRDERLNTFQTEKTFDAACLFCIKLLRLEATEEETQE